MCLHGVSYKTDRYSHEIGKAILDGLDTNIEQIRCGSVCPFKVHQCEQSPEDRQYDASVEQVISVRRLRLWHDIAPAAPWLWRHPVKTALE